MTTTGDSQPRSWAELVARWHDPPGSLLATYEYFRDEFREYGPGSPFLGTPLYQAVSSLTRAALMGEEDRVAGVVAEVAEPARAVASLDTEWNNLGAVAALTLEECGGWADGPPPLDGPLARVSAPGRDLREETRRQTIWALLAHGRIDGIADHLFEDPAAEPPDPDERFGASAWRVQLHLARCLHHGSGIEAAAPAWAACVGSFIPDLNADLTTFPELLWAARTVRVEVGGQDPATVLAWLRDEMAGAS